MDFTAQQIAEYLHGTVEGDASKAVRTFAKIEEGHEGAISFLSNPKYIHYICNISSCCRIIYDLQL